MSKSLFLKCHCCCSVVEIQSDDWYDSAADPKSENPFFNITLWQDGFTRPLGWRERLRWCGNILRTGNPWADHTIITAPDAQKLAEFILEKLDTYAKTKKSE